MEGENINLHTKYKMVPAISLMKQMLLNFTSWKMKLIDFGIFIKKYIF